MTRTLSPIGKYRTAVRCSGNLFANVSLFHRQTVDARNPNNFFNCNSGRTPPKNMRFR